MNREGLLEGVEFDNILLIPRVNDLGSREKDVDLSQQFENLNLRLPIVLSPMKGITNRKMVALMSDAGGIGILHRFYDNIEEWKEDIYTLETEEKLFGVAIGLYEDDKLEFAISHGAKIICIDVANGYIKPVRAYADYVSNWLYGTGVMLMTGNVVEQNGFKSLVPYSSFIRVGIGSGTLCTTRKVTGVGLPQVNALVSCEPYAHVNSQYKSFIVADGGIRSSGDIVKALWAGADLVMVGTLFGHAYESANNGVIYGMASRKLQEEYYHDTKSVEGIEKEIKDKKPFSEIIYDLEWGMRSAFTYLGVRNIAQLHRSDINVALI